MPLRIRKEVQDRLKASLDEGTPDGLAAPAALLGGAQAVRQQGRGLRSDVAWRHGLRPGRKARLMAEAAAEIEAIRALFDRLIDHAPDPDRLLALRSLTERWLLDDPSPGKLDQVRGILLRQAQMLRVDIAAAPLQEQPEASGNPPENRPPTPDRVRRGEPEIVQAPTQVKPPAQVKAEASAAPLKPEPRRRPILAWLRRDAGSRKPTGGSGGGPGDPSIQRHPLRARIRTALMASVWACVGLGAVGYAGSLVYVNYVRLEIDSALISGHVEPVNAPFDGSVTSLLVKAGDRLSEGMRLMVLEDPEIEKQVKLFGVRVERAREELRLKQVEFESEKGKRDEYISISRNKLEKILSEIDSFEKQEKVARERFERLAELFKKGIVIRTRVEDASDKLAEVTTLLAKARVNLRERESQFESVMAGHFYDGTQVVGRLKEAEAEVARASAKIDLALEELQAQQQRRQVNRVSAQHDARVLKVLRQEGSAVKRGDTMLVIERMDERVVHAFLRQDEANRVAIGDEAIVFVPALRARAVARVAGIERNAAFLDDVDARYSWKVARDGGPKPTDKDRTARVTLKFDGADRAVVDGKFEIGMPTVVSFRRRSVDTVFSNFTDIGSRL